MNKVVLMGRLTRDPEIRYSGGENSTAVGNYTLAVDRRFKRDNEPPADFDAFVLAKLQSLLRSICDRAQRSLSADGSRREATQIEMAIRYIRQIL